MKTMFMPKICIIFGKAYMTSPTNTLESAPTVAGGGGSLSGVAMKTVVETDA